MFLIHFTLNKRRVNIMHTCNTCGKSFKCLSKLEEHNYRQIPCRPASHHCSSCNKGFSSYQTLWKHKKRCRGEECVSMRKKRPLIHNDIPTFDGSEFGIGKPKSKETTDKLKRYVLGAKSPPHKATRVDTTLYSNDGSKVKSQIVNSVLSQQPMVNGKRVFIATTEG